MNYYKEYTDTDTDNLNKNEIKRKVNEKFGKVIKNEYL